MADATDKKPEDERTKRGYPGKGGAAPPPPPVPGQLSAPRLVAPTRGDGHNVLQFKSWFEVRLLSPHGGPIADEKVQMIDPKGTIVEKKTDKDGVVRFDDLPLLPPAGTDWRDTTNPAVVLPDIFEEWVKEPPGAFGKNKGARDDHRKGDGMVHFIPKRETRTDITPNTLSEAQKLQHFIDAYVDHNAQYGNAKPNDYASANQRWDWGKGAVCNQHVNFFLGYWFNYNKDFTTKGSATSMQILPLFSSKKEKFGTITHRGYLEFLDPVLDFGVSDRDPYDPADEETWPKVTGYNTAYKKMKYIRMAQFFDWDGNPTAEGETFIAALGAVNVYSLGDVKSDKEQENGEKAVRKWLKKHRADRAGGATDVQIDAKTAAQLWRIVFDLDETDAIDQELVHTLRSTGNYVNWDHHAGVILVAPKDDDATKNDLFTFSADGSPTNIKPIIRKRFADGDLKRKFLQLGIWRTRPLAPGGFAPEDAEDNKGNISIHAPPRFIHWG